MSGATSGQVYVADGLGSGTWTSQDPSYAQGWVENNTATTTISTINTPVQVNFGGNFNSDLVNKFTIDVNGVFTYTGADAITVLGNGALSVQQATGVTVEFTIFMAKNGTIIQSSLSVVQTDGSVFSNVALQSLVNLSTNDTITIWIENNTNTTNATVGDASITLADLGF